MGGVDDGGLRRAVGSAGRSELCWTSPSGRPDVLVVTPTWHDDALWFALPYSCRSEALAAAGAERVAVLLRPAREPALGPSLARGLVTLVEDPDGGTFVEHLLAQHLARHPPSRALADSVILRREHWWYVPRLLLRVSVTDRAPLPAPGWSLLAARADGSPAVSVVPSGQVGPRGADDAEDGPALLHTARASRDQEVLVEQRLPGRLRGGVLHVEDADRGHLRPAEVPVEPSLPSAPGLLARWRRQRAVQSACLAGLRDAGLA